MGEIAARGADVVVLTNDNPRSEDPLAILAALAARRGRCAVPVRRPVEVRARPARPPSTTAVALAEPGDVVVVAGKGHEQGQEVAA